MSVPEVGPTTRFGRLERRGVLLGLSGAQLAVVGAALLVAVVGVYSAGVTGLVLGAPVWVVLLAAGDRKRGRATGGGLAAVAGAVACPQSNAAARARRPLRAAVVPSETFGLPGLPGELELVDCAALGGTLIVDRRAATVTGVLRVDRHGVPAR